MNTNTGLTINFKFGTMIETVRACTRAGTLAENAEFFSFGTNDLTQATFSFSRGDAENKFLPLYNELGLLEDNPFEVLDIKGVGQLMELAAKLGRETRPDIKIGICGEQGGDIQSLSNFVTGSNWIMCPAPLHVFRLPDWQPLMPNYLSMKIFRIAEREKTLPDYV